MAVKEGSLGGMTGKPLKVDCADAMVVFVVAWYVVFDAVVAMFLVVR